MNFLTFLEQTYRARGGVAGGSEGPVREAPYLLGPCDVAKWSQDNKGECKRGDKNNELVAQMFKDYQSILDVKAGFRLSFSGTGAYANPFLDAASLAEAIINCDDSDPKLKFLKKDIVLCIRAMAGFGVAMSTWAWPACRHYYTVTSSEAQDGYTADFGTKHISGTEDMKSTQKVAQIRSVGPDQRQGIEAFGRIVTARSGGLVKSEIGKFSKEIKNRNNEFTETHEALAKYFKDNLVDFGGGPKKRFSYVDSVTFMTKDKYKMYEYENGKGYEADCYIRFSVSCTADGAKWAVHHLAGTSNSRVPANGTLLSAKGIAGGDAATTASFG